MIIRSSFAPSQETYLFQFCYTLSSFCGINMEITGKREDWEEFCGVYDSQMWIALTVSSAPHGWMTGFRLVMGMVKPPTPTLDRQDSSSLVTYMHSLGEEGGHYMPCMVAVFLISREWGTLVPTGGYNWLVWINHSLAGNWSLLLRDKQELCFIPSVRTVVWLGDCTHKSKVGGEFASAVIGGPPNFSKSQEINNIELIFSPYST